MLDEDSKKILLSLLCWLLLSWALLAESILVANVTYSLLSLVLPIAIILFCIALG